MDGAGAGTGVGSAADGAVAPCTGGTGDAACRPEAEAEAAATPKKEAPAAAAVVAPEGPEGGGACAAEAQAAAVGVAGGGAGAVKALRRSGAHRPQSASATGITAQLAKPEFDVTLTRSDEASRLRRSSSHGLLTRRPSSASSVGHGAPDNVERWRRRSVDEAARGSLSERPRRASFSVQVGQALSSCDTFAEALATGNTRSGCASRTSAMTFSAVRRPQGDPVDGAIRRRPLYEASGAQGPVRGSLQGKTLAEAIHSHNSLGARQERRVNAMSFSMKARNFDEIHRDAALMGARPSSAGRRVPAHVRPLSASTPVLHGRRRST